MKTAIDLANKVIERSDQTNPTELVAVGGAILTLQTLGKDVEYDFAEMIRDQYILLTGHSEPIYKAWCRKVHIAIMADAKLIDNQKET